MLSTKWISSIFWGCHWCQYCLISINNAIISQNWYLPKLQIPHSWWVKKYHLSRGIQAKGLQRLWPLELESFWIPKFVSGVSDRIFCERNRRLIVNRRSIMHAVTQYPLIGNIMKIMSHNLPVSWRELMAFGTPLLQHRRVSKMSRGFR